MMAPAEILQKARKAKGYTQESFASEIGLSLRMYQRYEEGLFPKYKSEKIKVIDQLLETNLNALIYDKKFRVELPSKEDQLSETALRFLKMLESQQRIIENLSSKRSQPVENMSALF